MDEVLIGGIEKREIVVVGYDLRWPAQFQQHAEILSRALGDKALTIEHVGSTSVPRLAAKPIIDIDVIVEDPSDEATYLPALVHAGYVLRVREPDWHQHRMFVSRSARPSGAAGVAGQVSGHASIHPPAAPPTGSSVPCQRPDPRQLLPAALPERFQSLHLATPDQSP